MKLSSSAFAAGGMIPARLTCDGENLSPPLEWSEIPQGTKSFVLLCDDPDAPTGLWRHWAAYDVPADRRSLAEGADRQADQLGFRHGRNDFHTVGYGGPCPPRDHGVHRYRFRVLALSTGHLPLSADPDCREIEDAARRHMLGEAELIGSYER